MVPRSSSGSAMLPPSTTIRMAENESGYLDVSHFNG
jgi:hypothetical protein